MIKYEEIVEINERQKANYLNKLTNTKQKSIYNNYKDLYTCRLYYDKESKKVVVKNNGENNCYVQLVKRYFSDIKDIYSFYELGPFFYIKNISELKKYSYVYNSYNISLHNWKTILNILREETLIEGIYFKKVDNLGRLLGKIVLSGGEIKLRQDIVISNIVKTVVAIIKKNNNLYVYSDTIIVLKSKYFENSSQVTHLFSRLNCSKLYIDNLDISDLKSLKLCFSNNIYLEELELRNFDTSNIETMHGMFYHCLKLKKVNLEILNTKNVTIFSYMFWDCYNIQNLDLSSFKTDKLVQMDNMFQDCYKLETLDISTWNININKIYLKDFLDNCTSIKEIKGIEKLLRGGLNYDNYNLVGFCPFLYKVLGIDFL